MNQYININSELDALKIKEVEKIFYNKNNPNISIIPKVTPFKGINTDLMYIEENKVLFIKFMDTSEDLFFLLEEELIEVMSEENDLLKIKMAKNYKDIIYNYIFIMPYVTLEDDYENDFVKNNIIDKNKLQSIIDDNNYINKYLKESNNDIGLNLFILDICPEYYVLNEKNNFNKNFKKISFYNEEYKYSANILEENQIVDVISIKYGNTLFAGGSGTGKSTIMLSRAIKLARVYPHHKFLILTESKQVCNELREKCSLLYKNNNNLEIHTLHTFVLKLAKRFNLVLDYNMLKKDYDKTFNNLIKQAQNIIKTKNMFKGIFIDEGECFLSYNLNFIREFLYKTKYIFNIFTCNCSNISNNLNIFKYNLYDIEFKEKVILNTNYRQTKELLEFVNNFSNNSNEYILSLRESNINNKFYISKSLREGNKNVDIIKVSDLYEQISSVLWEIDYLVNKKGLDYGDIGIIYPYNKKKLKNGKTIYFQYMLKKALEESEIPYIYAEDNLTNISKKIGVTISNIYTIKGLEYKAIIVCELEMLYNHKIMDIHQDYQINDFVGDLNKVYSAINRASDYLSIITTFNENSSDIIKLLIDSK